ncbi:hypothetical protein K1W69_19365 [Hoeflea sp. WL0058]|uniref:Uncharacterized protein n=1 Tax=Flavimaribacter sediminis TaxID=2865987 RepID=A0AAE2ZTL4_9HYPH|nr:hypothetical protein [Flavimaribacter sediminis]MBW8639362.1 hypothetical protein [Flavimaribacter sediminis]
MTDVIIFTLFGLAVASWIVVAVAGFLTARNRRPTSNWRFWFDPGVHWRHKLAAEHLTEKGMRYHALRSRALFLFIASCFVLMVAILLVGKPV